MPVTTEQATLASLGAGAVGVDADLKHQAYLAAEGYVSARCTWNTTPLTAGGADPAAPPALVQAVQLLTRRYLERRNTPSGVLGSGDFGIVRVSGSDRDVDALIAPYRRLVMG